MKKSKMIDRILKSKIWFVTTEIPWSKAYIAEKNTFLSKEVFYMAVSFNAVKKNKTLGQFLEEKEEGDVEWIFFLEKICLVCSGALK